MVGLLLFCLMYILYVYNELRKIADVGSQMGKAILQPHKRYGWQGEASACQLPNWWTLQACSGFKELKSANLKNSGVLRCMKKAQKAARMLKEEVEYLFHFFFSIFSQLCSLEPAINFRKIKHPNKTSLKLWNLRSFLCLHQRLKKTFSQAVGLMARTPQPLLQTLDGWMVGQDKEEWVSPRPL